MSNYILYTPMCVFWALLMISMCLDMRRFRNCIFLMAAIVTSVPPLLSLCGPYEQAVTWIVVVFVFLLLLGVPVFLIYNGLVMLKKEGRSLANLLSLFFGILIGLGEIAAFWGTTYNAMNPKASGWMILFTFSVIYVSLAFVCFMVYSLFIGIIPRRRDFDYVIIHGCGLLDGNRMSKLLSQRCDKAIEIYKKDKTRPIMIPSGGQGPDEMISEAAAMAQYLRDHDVDPRDIVIEDKSMNTMENLINSRKIIEERGGRQYTALVTSNYHVYRVLSYSRKLSFRCTGIGSKVASYYWPSALIREFAAVLKEKRHLILFVIGYVLFILPWLSILLYYYKNF